MTANLLIALAGLFILSLALAPIIGAWLRSRQPEAPETCGQCRWLEPHLDGLLCDRRAIWRLRTSQACDIGENRP